MIIDPDTFDDWEMTWLRCGFCRHEWQGPWSKKAAHGRCLVVKCPKCRSLFGPHPIKDPKLSTPPLPGIG